MSPNQSERDGRRIEMNLQIETRLSDQLARYLDLTVNESKLTAVNMANIDTPGYRTLGIDFASEMRDAMEGIDAGRAMQSSHVKLVDGLISRPDGNNVSMDREGLQLAEEQLKFRTGVALLRLENQRVMDAIHADK
jgi:flagellar basal-body rod protein FlgB